MKYFYGMRWCGAEGYSMSGVVYDRLECCCGGNVILYGGLVCFGVV